MIRTLYLENTGYLWILTRLQPKSSMNVDQSSVHTSSPSTPLPKHQSSSTYKSTPDPLYPQIWRWTTVRHTRAKRSVEGVKDIVDDKSLNEDHTQTISGWWVVYWKGTSVDRPWVGVLETEIVGPWDWQRGHRRGRYQTCKHRKVLSVQL